jgi:hypothetical protein
MSRWTIAFLSLSVIAFSLAASAADDGLQRNIALKPGAAPTDEAAGQTGEGSSSGMTTRRFFTEGKNAPTAEGWGRTGNSAARIRTFRARGVSAPPSDAEGPPPPRLLRKHHSLPPKLQSPLRLPLPLPGLKPEEVVVQT